MAFKGRAWRILLLLGRGEKPIAPERRFLLAPGQ